MSGSRMQLSREEMEEILREHDLDGDGCLNKRELTQAFGSMGYNMPMYKAHYGLACADADGDGVITEDEMGKLVDYVFRSQTLKKRCNNDGKANKSVGR